MNREQNSPRIISDCAAFAMPHQISYFSKPGIAPASLTQQSIPSDLCFHLYDQAPFGYCTLNEKGAFIDINTTAVVLLDTNRGELKGKSFSRFIFPEDLASYYLHRDKLLETSKKQTYQIRMMTSAGSPFWTLIVTTLDQDTDGALLYRFVITDINELKKEEDGKAGSTLSNQLKKTNREQSISQFAGKVAHKFNNMLGVIAGYAEIALQQVSPGQPLYDDLGKIKKATDQCAEFTQQLFTFGKKQRFTPEIISLNEIIDERLKLLHQTHPANIQLIWRPGTDLWSVKIDRLQFVQILTQLYENAREAITSTGVITIQTENITVDAPHRIEQPSTPSGEYVQLTLSDNGSGIAEAILDKVFNPFFTTKQSLSNLGLGLTTVVDVVEQNNGHITLKSTPGKGTTCTLLLPRHKKAKQNKISGAGVGRPAMSTIAKMETILLVDDDPIILEMLTRLLTQQNYTILKANNAEEALSLTEEEGDNIDLLITDIAMPGMDGDELALILLDRYPSLKCLFMSGYTLDIVTEREFFNEERNFIQKPFGINTVLDKIDTMLNKQ